MLEFDGAGAVDEGEGVAEEADVGDVELDAHAVVAGFGRGVADRVLVGDLALSRHGAGAGEDGFQKCGLAGEIRPDQCDAAGAAAGRASHLPHGFLLEDPLRQGNAKLARTPRLSFWGA